MDLQLILPVKYYFIGISLIFSCSQIHETDRLDIFDAEKLYRSGNNYQEAVDSYKKIMGEYQIIDGSKVLDAIDCASLAKDSSATVHFMEYGFKIGFTPAVYQKLWKQVGNGLEYSTFISSCDTVTYIELYKSGLKQNLISKMADMAERDQRYRSKDETDWIEQKKLDSLNWNDLMMLVQTLGRLPDYTEIGFEGYEDLELLFYHMDLSALEGFLPYVIESIGRGQSNLAHTVLYHLDRIGMDDGLIYTITEDYKIKSLGQRTKMKNQYSCQTLGEWFLEKSPLDGKLYVTPLDPNMHIEETDRIRRLFGQDSWKSKQERQPWSNFVSLEQFAKKIL